VLKGFSSPILLLIDNVPEDGSRGIAGMLPDPLPACLPHGCVGADAQPCLCHADRASMCRLTPSLTPLLYVNGCRSRIIATCRSSSPRGLPRLDSLIKYAVECLGDHEAKQVLQADQLPLTEQQLSAVLNYCAGLPLALVVIGSALQG